MSLDTSITRRYLGSVSMLTVSAVMYVNYRIRGEFILISILLSILERRERVEKDRDSFSVKSFTRYISGQFFNIRVIYYTSRLFFFVSRRGGKGNLIL